MSLLETISSWLRSLLGAEPAEPAEEEPAEEGPAEETGGSEPEPQLDPDGVTEVRMESDDDPIDRLQEVKQKREEQASDDGDAGGAAGSEEPDTDSDVDTDSDTDSSTGRQP